jgi:hypothetical protein
LSVGTTGGSGGSPCGGGRNERGAVGLMLSSHAEAPRQGVPTHFVRRDVLAWKVSYAPCRVTAGLHLLQIG